MSLVVFSQLTDGDVLSHHCQPDRTVALSVGITIFCCFTYGICRTSASPSWNGSASLVLSERELLVKQIHHVS